MNHGWQGESADGPKGGCSCIFWSGCSGIAVVVVAVVVALIVVEVDVVVTL